MLVFVDFLLTFYVYIILQKFHLVTQSITITITNNKTTAEQHSSLMMERCDREKTICRKFYLVRIFSLSFFPLPLPLYKHHLEHCVFLFDCESTLNQIKERCDLPIQASWNLSNPFQRDFFLLRFFSFYSVGWQLWPQFCVLRIFDCEVIQNLWDFTWI